jgi:hypothetical protein
MGLDMYAYVATRENQNREYWDTAVWDTDTKSYTNDTVGKPLEIAYWRKHPNLHGWFEQLWQSKGCPGADEGNIVFNGVELELTSEDLDQLEADIKASLLPETTGFFFGDPSDDYYRESDLKFIKEARTHLFLGLRVFYDSSW